MGNSARFPETIACHFEMFSDTMQVFVFKNSRIQTVNIPSEDAAQILVGLCYEQNIYRLKIGGNEKFLEKFVDDIRTIETSQYGENTKIEITIEEE